MGGFVGGDTAFEFDLSHEAPGADGVANNRDVEVCHFAEVGRQFDVEWLCMLSRVKMQVVRMTLPFSVILSIPITSTMISNRQCSASCTRSRVPKSGVGKPPRHTAGRLCCSGDRFEQLAPTSYSNDALERPKATYSQSVRIRLE